MRKSLLVGGLAVFMVTGFVLSGCMIDPPDYPNRAANILELKPANLERLPDGVMYEGWPIMSFNKIIGVGGLATGRSIGGGRDKSGPHDF